MSLTIEGFSGGNGSSGGNSEAKYAWKKYDKKSENHIFTVKCDNYNSNNWTLNLSSTTYTDKIPENIMLGRKLIRSSDSQFYILFDSSIQSKCQIYNYSGLISECTYYIDSIYKTIEITLNGPSYTNGYGDWSNFTYSTQSNFLNFCISDNISEYPDNGVQNGYYYRKI